MRESTDVIHGQFDEKSSNSELFCRLNKIKQQQKWQQKARKIKQEFEFFNSQTWVIVSRIDYNWSAHQIYFCPSWV